MSRMPLRGLEWGVERDGIYIEKHENRFADSERREGSGCAGGARASRPHGARKRKQGKIPLFPLISHPAPHLEAAFSRSPAMLLQKLPHHFRRCGILPRQNGWRAGEWLTQSSPRPQRERAGCGKGGGKGPDRRSPGPQCETRRERRKEARRVFGGGVCRRGVHALKTHFNLFSGGQGRERQAAAGAKPLPGTFVSPSSASHRGRAEARPSPGRAQRVALPRDLVVENV